MPSIRSGPATMRGPRRRRCVGPAVHQSPHPWQHADMRHNRAVRAISIAIVALVTASCQAGSPAKAPTGSSRAAAQSGCGAERRFLPTQTDLPGFTQYVQYPTMQWPGTSLPGHPGSLQLLYVCGEFDGFVATIALTGVYRQENNERARKFGYTPGKWPFTPLTGQIVQQNEHRVLEIYTTLFQFKSRNYAVTLDLQGGADLDWSDAVPYWIKINSLLQPLESGRSPAPAG
jgi:hypothetical protein